MTRITNKNIAHPLVTRELCIGSSIGNKKISSTSKTRKIKAIKKNCREKGSRLLLWAQKPHSKGELLAGLLSLFLEHENKTPNSNAAKVILNTNCTNKMLIGSLEASPSFKLEL